MSVRTGTKAAEFCPLFDGPDGGGVIERRNQSIVAPQALFLLNDPLVNDLAAAFGASVSEPTDSPAEAYADWSNEFTETRLKWPPG